MQKRQKRTHAISVRILTDLDVGALQLIGKCKIVIVQNRTTATKVKLCIKYTYCKSTNSPSVSHGFGGLGPILNNSLIDW